MEVLLSVEWLFPKTRWVILESLFAHSGQELYVNQLIRLAGGGSAHVQRELRLFTEEGLLLRRQIGNQVHYRANPKHPLYSDLRSIVLKTVGLVDVLREALSGLAGIELAFVYGSFAKGEIRADSDVDLMVLGKVKFAQVVKAVMPAIEKLEREINPSVFKPQEYKKKLSSGNHFLRQVTSGPKLFVIGIEDDLARMGSSP
jgi:predicted nucleotidyltransferase